LVDEQQALVADRLALIGQQPSLVGEPQALVALHLALVRDQTSFVGRQQVLVTKQLALVRDRQALIFRILVDVPGWTVSIFNKILDSLDEGAGPRKIFFQSPSSDHFANQPGGRANRLENQR